MKRNFQRYLLGTLTNILLVIVVVTRGQSGTVSLENSF